MVMIACSWILVGLCVARGEPRRSLFVTKSARFDELENIYFVGYKVLPPRLK